MLVRPVQLLKALSPMLVTLLGIVMLVRPVQYSKAPFPMLVTLLGIVMLVRPVQLLKAQISMLVTGIPSILDGIVIAPFADLSQPVIVTLLSELTS